MLLCVAFWRRARAVGDGVAPRGEDSTMTCRPQHSELGRIPHTEEVGMAEERTGAVTMRGNPVTLVGPEIKVGQAAPECTLVDTGLQPVRLSDAKGKVVILST